jgi:hypothetical protein
MPKRMSGNTLIYWIEDATYDPAAPKIGLLTAARDISCAIETGYTLNPAKSDVNTKQTICEDSKVETPIRYNYEGQMTFFREGDLADSVSAFAKAFAFFGTARKTGYLVRRAGLPRTTPIAIGQKVDSFKFINDVPQDTVDEDLIQFSTKFLQQGRMELNKAIVA